MLGLSLGAGQEGIRLSLGATQLGDGLRPGLVSCGLLVFGRLELAPAGTQSDVLFTGALFAALNSGISEGPGLGRLVDEVLADSFALPEAAALGPDFTSLGEVLSACAGDSLWPA